MIKKFNSKEEIEFEILKKVEDLEKFNEEEIHREIKYLFEDWDLIIAKIIKEVDNKLIANNPPSFYLIEGDYKVGDFVIIQKRGYGKYANFDIKHIEEECFTEDFLGFWKENKKGGVQIKFEDLKMFTKEELMKEIKRKRVILNKLEEDRQREIKEKEEKLKTQENDFIKKGFYNDTNLDITNNEIMMGGLNYEVEKDVNKVFKFSEIINYNYSPEKMILHLLKNKINVKKYKNRELIYDMKFIGKNVILNGKKIEKKNIPLILRTLQKIDNKERINLRASIGVMRTKILEFKTISITSKKFPIEIELINKDNFKVKFMGKTKNIGWKKIREIFFGNKINPERILNPVKIIKLLNIMKIPKEELFNILTKKKVMDGLK